MKNKFSRSVTAIMLTAALLISSQGVVTAFADGGDHSDMSESSSVQMNEVSNNGTDQSTENGTGEDAAVKDIVEMINALPAAETITEETDLVSLKDQVNAARAAYDALSEEQKAAFDIAVLEKLTALENKISDLESNEQETKPSDAVQAVVDAINALPAVEDLNEETNYEDLKALVASARAAYDALSEEQKAAFDAATLEKLTALEDKISELESGEQETAPSEAVQNIIEKIDAAVELIDYTTETIPATDGTTVTKTHIRMLKDLDPANNAELKALIDKEAAHEQDENQPALTAEEAAKLSDARKVFEDAKAKYLSEGFSNAQLAARQAYDALATEEEKAQVTNYSLLTDMEANIAYIMQPANTLPEETGHPTEIAPGSYLTSSGLTITFRYVDLNTKEDLSNTDFFLETVPKADDLEDLAYPEEFFENNPEEFYSIGFEEHYNYNYLFPFPDVAENTEYQINGDTYTFYRHAPYSGPFPGRGDCRYYLICPDGTISPDVNAAYDMGLFKNEFKDYEMVIELSFKKPNEPPVRDDECLTNSISLERSLSQNGMELKAVDSQHPDTFVIDKKDSVFVTYDPSMDMQNLKLIYEQNGSLFDIDGWGYLQMFWENILEETTVYLNFEFDENIDLTQFDQDAFEKIELNSSMFELNDYKVNGQHLKLICNWKENASTDDPVIQLNNLTLPVKSDWDGNSLTIKNSGFVKGIAIYTLSSGPEALRIDCSSVTDEFTLKLPDPVDPTDPPVEPPVDPTPDPDPDPTPRPGGGGDEDDDTPTIINETPVPTTTIEDEDVPMADLPEDTVTIDDEEVPLKDNPNTGDAFPVAAMAAAALSLGGVVALNRKKK